jgi:hypothetical protein
VEGLVRIAPGEAGKGVVASYPSDYMARAAVMGTAVAQLGDSCLVSTCCYCYCISGVPESEGPGDIGRGARQCHTVLGLLNALEPSALELVQPAHVACSKLQLAVVAGYRGLEIG